MDNTEISMLALKREVERLETKLDAVGNAHYGLYLVSRAVAEKATELGISEPEFNLLYQAIGMLEADYARRN